MDEPFELNHEHWAVWWTVTWPGMLLGVAAFFAVATLTEHIVASAIVGHAVFFSMKALLIPRAIRKEYKAFWIGIVRGDEVSRDLTTREHTTLVRQRVLPLATAVVFTAGIMYLIGYGTPFVTSFPVPWILDATMLPITGINPYKLGINLKRVPQDCGFRLQAYRRAKAIPHQTAA